MCVCVWKSTFILKVVNIFNKESPLFFSPDELFENWDPVFASYSSHVARQTLKRIPQIEFSPDRQMHTARNMYVRHSRTGWPT